MFSVRNVHCPSGQRVDGQQTGGSTEKYSDPGTENQIADMITIVLFFQIYKLKLILTTYN